MRYVIILISVCALACGVRKTDLNRERTDFSQQLKRQTETLSVAKTQTVQIQADTLKTQSDKDVRELETIVSVSEVFDRGGTLVSRKTVGKRRLVTDKSKVRENRQTQKIETAAMESGVETNARATLTTDSVKNTVYKKTTADKTLSVNFKSWSLLIIIALVAGLAIYFKRNRREW